MRTHDDGLIVVAHRIPAQVTPVGEWPAEVADRVTLITRQYTQPRSRNQRGTSTAWRNGPGAREKGPTPTGRRIRGHGPG